MNRLTRLLALSSICAVVACGPADEELGSQQAQSTETFNRHLVLLDEQLSDPEALTGQQIQGFLELTPHGNRSVLADHLVGSGRAADAITTAASSYGINPLVLLTRLQLEQSLVSRTSATQKKLDWAMGCGCPDYSNCMEAYRGFDKQVECAAERLRSYLDDQQDGGTTIAGWKVGKAKTTLDGYTVTPKSQATAAIYTYTPWLYSAKDHFSIWSKYAEFVGYQTPAPGGCGVVTYPSQVAIQLRPDEGLSSEYDGQVSCFLDADQLIAPGGIGAYDSSVEVADHFRLSEFVAVASSRRMLLEPALVSALEATRVTLGSSISPRLAYQSRAAHDAACQACVQTEDCPGWCRSEGLRLGSGVLVDSPAGTEAVLQAAAGAGVPACWGDGDWVYLGLDADVGCPSAGP